MSYVRVAVDVPLPTLFDYCYENATDDLVGALALVPFGRKKTVGVVLEVSPRSALDAARIRPLVRVLKEIPPLPADIIALLRFCSEYYHHPIGEVVHSALPAGLRVVRQRMAPRLRAVAITVKGHDALRDGAMTRAPALVRLLTRLDSCSSLTSGEFTTGERRILRRLLERGWVEELAPSLSTARGPGEQSSAVPVLTPEQDAAVGAILPSLDRFHVWLLHGITGSGKTEVYLRVMEATLRVNGQVLFLVPEIGLTPQLEGRIRDRFPDRYLVTLHSALSARERTQNWLAAQSGAAQIVLGTRSAVFAPLPRLALVIIDEEHDSSYKQIEAMRYSARDLAIWRARQRNVSVILGSATPCLETYQSALQGRYTRVRLTLRANAQPHPRITLVPTVGARLHEGFVPVLIKAIGERVAAREQVLVYINRRGYAPVLLCGACGWAASCHRCSARLVMHKIRQRLLCHHCGHEEPVATVCADCGNIDLRALGHGTQRIETALQTVFPQARLMRIDRDTTRGRNVWPGMRRAIENREVDILIGTQLLSKGHDFAGLGLVAVLNADRSLYSTDFRAAEQLFAQLMQVAGRAGRGAAPGEVLIQTAFPAHPLYRAVQKLDFDAFARELLDERSQASFPPFAYQAVLRAEATRLAQALAFLHDAAQFASPYTDGISVFDPAPALMTRLKGRERAQLLVQSASRSRLHRFLARWVEEMRSAKPTNARWAIDVDPLDV